MLAGVLDPEVFADRSAEALLGRSLHECPFPESDWQQRRVLITGAGTVGRGIATRLMAVPGLQLAVLDHAEQPLFRTRMATGGRGAAGSGIRWVLGSVRERSLVHRIVEEFQPDTVFHTAAIKHVAIAEANPVETVRTNVLGTEVVLSAALSAGVERFVLVSTDKAVEPVSLMGASKRLAERLVCAADHPAGSATACMVVRSGNVLGSTGSVLAAFLHQVARGGALPVRSGTAERLFLTPSETSGLILAAKAAGRAGDICVPMVSTAVRLADLTERFLRVLNLDPEYPLAVSQLLPGERASEKLWSGTAPEASGAPGISVVSGSGTPWDDLERPLSELGIAAHELNVNGVIEILRQLVVEYALTDEQVPEEREHQ